MSCQTVKQQPLSQVSCLRGVKNAFMGFSSEVALSCKEVVMSRVDFEELLCLTECVWFLTLNVVCFGSFVAMYRKCVF